MKPLGRSALEHVMQTDREIRLMELMVIINTIHDAARAITGGTGSSKTKDALKLLKELLFPEWGEEERKKGKSTQELLKKEFESGSIKVQSASYETTGKRKARSPRTLKNKPPGTERQKS